MKRVRGKTLTWLALVTLLLFAPAINLGAGQEITLIWIDPPLVTELLPGDSFEIAIWINNAYNVYAWEIQLSFAPRAEILSIVDVIEGDFLMLGGETFFVKYEDPFRGLLKVGNTLIGDVPGVDGDGILCFVRFLIVEAGECALDLHDTVIIDPQDILLSHEVEDGYYLGPTADLYNVPGSNSTIVGKRRWKVGDTKKFKAIAVNTGYAPLYVRAKYTTVRDDGAVFTLYSGQHLYTTQPRETEYYYVNSFTPIWTDWNTTGSSPYLEAIEDGSYITGTEYCQLIGLFDFEDITLAPGDIIKSVTLEGYTRSDHIDIDMDVYVFIGWSYAGWAGSLWGGDTWSWHTVRWVTAVTSERIPALLTEDGFNDFRVVIHYWTPTGEPLGDAQIDALRLKVEFTGLAGDPAYCRVDPGETVKINPDAVWDLYSFDVASYVTTVTIEYKYFEPDPRFIQVWQTGPTVITYSWSVRP